MDGDLRFSGSGKKRGNATKRKRHKGGEARDEKTVIVRVNGKPEKPEHACVVATHELADYTLDGLLAAAGAALFDGKPAACLYHDDGILVTNLNLVKEAETLYAAPDSRDMFTGTAQALPAADPTDSPKVEALPSPDKRKTAADLQSLATAAIIASPEAFVASAAFVGAKKRYFFARLDDRGPGYHQDPLTHPDLTDHPAPLDNGQADGKPGTPSLGDLLSIYGGGSHLGRAGNVHAVSEAAPKAFRPAVAAPEEGGRGKQQQQAAGKPALGGAKKNAPAAGKSGAAPQRGTLGALHSILSTAGEDRETVRAGQSKTASYAAYAQQTMENDRARDAETERQTAGLALQEVGLAEREGAAKEAGKKERQSKRARKRAKKRAEKEDGAEEDGEDSEGKAAGE
ncbi:hypothetical protein DIPPA_01068 [Diplonema papillatum]|nr:hypothetical protein DIPPA_01068 [Diplonema papillatum]